MLLFLQKHSLSVNRVLLRLFQWLLRPDLLPRYTSIALQRRLYFLALPLHLAPRERCQFQLLFQVPSDLQVRPTSALLQLLSVLAVDHLGSVAWRRVFLYPDHE